MSILKIVPLSFAFSSGSSSSLTTSSSNPTSERHVHFADAGQNIVHEDDGRFPMEARRQEDQQYSADELADIKQGIRFSKSLRDRDMIPSGYDWRGLEVIRDGGTHKLQQKRRTRIQEVLALQRDLQNLEARGLKVTSMAGQQEPLRDCAQAHSQAACRAARKRGKQDEAAAKQVYQVKKLIWDGNQNHQKSRSFIGSLLQGSHTRIHLASVVQKGGSSTSRATTTSSHEEKLREALQRAQQYESYEATAIASRV